MSVGFSSYFPFRQPAANSDGATESPVIAEQVVREQPEHLREYFMERVKYYREQSISLSRASDPRYLDMAEQNSKK